MCEIKFGWSLNAAQLVRDVTAKIEVLRKAFAAYAVEKVLITYEKAPEGAQIGEYFDRVLTAGEMFL